MQEIKTYADITKAANAMQRERESKQDLAIHNRDGIYSPAQFEEQFQQIFANDEAFETPKHKTLVDIHADHGVSIHDF